MTAVDPTRPSILICGRSHAQPVLDRSAVDLKSRGFDVTTHYGDTLDLAGDPMWQKAEIAALYDLPCGQREMDAAPHLHALLSPVIGYDWIDAAAASERNILLVNGETEENYESMAEAAVLLILASLYDLAGAQDNLRTSQNRRRAPMMLKRRTVGLIGYGNIARSVVDRLQPWGCNFLVHRRSAHDDKRSMAVGLEELLERSDVVVVLASLTPETRHMIGAAELAMMKTDGVLINLARGGLIDEQALYDHARTNPDMRLALDVFEKEPLPVTSPLRTLEGAILTSHEVGHTLESIDAIAPRLVSNVLQVAAGRVPANCRNAEVAGAWRGRLVVRAGAKRARGSRKDIRT